MIYFYTLFWNALPKHNLENKVFQASTYCDYLQAKSIMEKK